jgi:hypothetical protein
MPFGNPWPPKLPPNVAWLLLGGLMCLGLYPLLLWASLLLVLPLLQSGSVTYSSCLGLTLLLGQVIGLVVLLKE